MYGDFSNQLFFSVHRRHGEFSAGIMDETCEYTLGIRSRLLMCTVSTPFFGFATHVSAVLCPFRP